MTNLITTEQLAKLCCVPVGVINSMHKEGRITPLIRRGKYVRWHYETVLEQLKPKKPLLK